MMTYFFLDNERYDFSLRLLLTEWLDFRDESSYVPNFRVLFFDNDFSLLFDLSLLNLETLFYVELQRDFLLGVP